MEDNIDVVKCTLKQIRFTADDGFIIGMFDKGDNTLFGGKGNMIDPKVEEQYVLRGTWVMHDRWGRQLLFNTYDVVQPKDKRGIFHYLTKVCKQVGNKTAEKMLDLWGENTLEMLKKEPEMVAKKIRGITEDRAIKIQAVLVQNENVESARVELEGILQFPGAKKSLANDLIKKFGSNAPAILRKNPYILTQFKSVGFKQADIVAVNRLKFDRESVFRKSAACRHVIREAMAQGSVWINCVFVEKTMLNLLSVSDVSSGIDVLIENGHVVEREGYLAFDSSDQNETIIAATICWMVQKRRYEYA